MRRQLPTIAAVLNARSSLRHRPPPSFQMRQAPSAPAALVLPAHTPPRGRGEAAASSVRPHAAEREGGGGSRVLVLPARMPLSRAAASSSPAAAAASAPCPLPPLTREMATTAQENGLLVKVKRNHRRCLQLAPTCATLGHPFLRLPDHCFIALYVVASFVNGEENRTHSAALPKRVDTGGRGGSGDRAGDAAAVRLAVDRAARFSSRADSGTVGAAGVDDAAPTGGRRREQTSGRRRAIDERVASSLARSLAALRVVVLRLRWISWVEMGEAPRPKSPPRYPDLCGRRRLQLEMQILNREVGFLEVTSLHFPVMSPRFLSQ
uniref:Uncharacterized protein n=1 Tax=Oryza sativa subsp. japonica TaxID=39947 RepID=Q6Z0Q4_ORYSJ|nr:hypothetical protein [Oryza sativa Japonica Group]